MVIDEPPEVDQMNHRSPTHRLAKRRAVGLVAALGLAAAGFACGGDDGGGAGSGPQAEFANQLIAEANQEGFGIDESCVRRVTSELSDADARALLADDDEALTTEGAMQMFALFECIDLDLGDLDFGELDDPTQD